MAISTVVSFLYGATAMGCAIAARFFLRFWRDSHDSLFLTFSIAFCIFAINYTILGVVSFAADTRPYVVLLRLLGFIAILAGIFAKNRGRRKLR